MTRYLIALAGLLATATGVLAQGCTGGFAGSYGSPYGYAPQSYGYGVGPQGNQYSYSVGPQGYGGSPSAFGYGYGVGPRGNEYSYSVGQPQGFAPTTGPLFVPRGDGRFEVFVRSPSGAELDFRGGTPRYRPPPFPSPFGGGGGGYYGSPPQYYMPPTSTYGSPIVGEQSFLPAGGCP